MPIVWLRGVQGLDMDLLHPTPRRHSTALADLFPIRCFPVPHLDTSRQNGLQLESPHQAHATQR